jgi:acetyl-CoA carboxylase biotin carboxyl carrier protein
MKSADIDALVALFSKSGWDEMLLEVDGEELFLSTDPSARKPTAAAAAPVALPAAAPAVATAPAAAAPAPAPAAAASVSARPANWVAIKAANLGTFYKASAPDAPPYVTVGASVGPDTEVCMIEVMKLFTTIRAGIGGTVREICATDGQMVEFGQELMWIEPN